MEQAFSLTRVSFMVLNIIHSGSQKCWVEIIWKLSDISHMLVLSLIYTANLQSLLSGDAPRDFMFHVTDACTSIL